MAQARKEQKRRDQEAVRRYDAAKKRFIEPGAVGAAGDEFARVDAKARRQAEPHQGRGAGMSADPKGTPITRRPAAERITPGPAPDED